ncbi:MAG: tellurite resistance TerB family protein, partial [Pseudomonadota bacterium]
PTPLTPQDCLVATMIATSASDEEVRTSELVTIQMIVNHLPIFGNYDTDRINQIAQLVFDFLQEEDGLDAFFGLVKDNLPERFYDTAYALSCDVAAADGMLGQSELAFLQEVRDQFELDRLDAAAIERGARARFRTLKTATA